MPPVYNPTVARATIRGTQDGQVITNVLHFDSPVDWTAARLEALSGILLSFLNVDLMPLLSNQYTIRELIVDSLAGINAPRFVASVGLPIVGSETSPALPNNVSLAVSFKSGFRGRSGQGRFFLAGLTENDAVNSRVDAGFRSAVVDAFDDLPPVLLAQDMRLVIYSTISQGAPRPVGIAFPVTSISIVDDVLDSQRRRLPGRGA